MEAAPPSDDVLAPVRRVVVVLRWLLLGHALAVNAVRRHEVVHPGWFLVVNVGMVVWTVLAWWWQGRRPLPRRQWSWTDLVVTLCLLAPSRWILGSAALLHGEPAVPVLWMVAAPVAVAAQLGAGAGLLAAVLVGAVRMAQSPHLDERALTATVVTCLAAWGIGSIVSALRQAGAEREAETARAAALAERDRMNRLVHDGALQVLAMVERDGPGLGARGVELASLAREQEVALRRQLSDRDLSDVDAPGGEVDLVELLEGHEDARVTVSATVDALGLPAAVVAEVDAAVAEALANVRRHAGDGARAWVLVEDEGDHAVVSVRDDGVGTTVEQMEAAAVAGRLGVRQSIRGRIEATGGRATVTCRPSRGVEWEFHVPKGAAVQGFQP